MNKKTVQFWEWFKKNSNAFLFINQVNPEEKERLLNLLQTELHKFCDKLFFEAGGHPDGKQELIISAEGNRDYFDKVEELVSAAPEIPEWTFIAFLPARGADFQIDFEGTILKPREMWFMPLVNEKNPDAIGIRVCMKMYESLKDKSFFMSAIYKTIDIIVGEKVFAMDIDYVDAGQLQENPEKEGMIKLEELPQYIEWKKNKRAAKEN